MNADLTISSFLVGGGEMGERTRGFDWAVGGACAAIRASPASVSSR